MTWKLALLCLGYGVSAGIGLFGGFELVFGQRSLGQLAIILLVGFCGLTFSAMGHLLLFPPSQQISFHLKIPKGVILRADTVTYITTQEWHIGPPLVWGAFAY